MVITTADGSRYTGVAILERNNIVVLFAVGEQGARAPASQPAAQLGFTGHDEDDPRRRESMSLWEHGHRQRLQDDEEDDGWRR